jgi:NAD-dependent deacetylase
MCCVKPSMDAAVIADRYPGLVEALRGAGHIVVSTGAGVSAESGIATYRDARTGVWEHFDPRRFATLEAFTTDPALVWAWYECRRAQVDQVAPNAAHRAIARLEHRVDQCTVITQNIDNLHERAGSADVIHLHGSLFAPRCLECGRPATFPPVVIVDPSVECRIDPPRCESCDALVRPGVVWFGEPLSHNALTTAVEAASACDVLLSVGTSSTVYPAADLPFVAARLGATVVQVNPEPTPLDTEARFNVREPAAHILPALVEAAWPSADTAG